MVARVVDAFTKALPMRSIFYHHVLFTIIITKLPLLHYDTCEFIVEAVGWGVIGVCALVCLFYSFIVEKLPWYWCFASLGMYLFIAYVTTPQFFSCYGFLYDTDIHQWMVVGLFASLGVIKAFVFLDKRALAGKKGPVYTREREDLNLLGKDDSRINKDMDY